MMCGGLMKTSTRRGLPGVTRGLSGAAFAIGRSWWAGISSAARTAEHNSRAVAIGRATIIRAFMAVRPLHHPEVDRKVRGDVLNGVVTAIVGNTLGYWVELKKDGGEP